MTTLSTPLSPTARNALVLRARVHRSQAIAGLIRGVISAIRRRFPPRDAVSRVSHTPVSLADLKA